MNFMTMLLAAEEGGEGASDPISGLARTLELYGTYAFMALLVIAVVVLWKKNNEKGSDKLLKAETDSDDALTNVGARITELRNELQTQFTTLKTDLTKSVDGLRDELSTQFDEFEAKIESELGIVRTSSRDEIERVRTSYTDVIKEKDTEIRRKEQEAQGLFDTVKERYQEQIAMMQQVTAAVEVLKNTEEMIRRQWQMLQGNQPPGGPT